MVDKERLKPMSDIGFRAMVWIFKLVDLFGGPGIYLLKVPLKQGMTVLAPLPSRAPPKAAPPPKGPLSITGGW